MASYPFEKMADCFYDCNWIELPIGVQKHIVTMIIMAQKPIFYHGYGLVTMNLETFTTVSSTEFY